MKKIIILLSMSIPYLFITYLRSAKAIVIPEEWDSVLLVIHIVVFAMFCSGLVAFVVSLIKDFVNWCKAKRESKRNK